MQYYEDLIQYFDEHRSCILFCDPDEDFTNIYEIFKYHETTFFKIYKISLYVIGTITNIFVSLTIFILLNYGNNLAKTYRNMMVSNIFLPALLTNHICFLFQPYAIGPNFIIYSLGPIRTSYAWTYFFIATLVLISAPLTFLLFAQLSYHAFIIIKPQTALKMFWINLTWISLAICSIGFNMIVFFLAIDHYHYRLEKEILIVDKRYQYVIDNYAPYIIDLKTATIPMNVILLEAIYAILLFTVGMFLATVAILRSYWKNRPLISARLTTAQRNIIVTIAIYALSYLGLLGFPSIAAGLTMLLGAQATYFPFAALYFCSSSLVASTFCFINLLTVTPYRRALRSLFSRLLPNLVGSNDTSATVSGNQVAVANARFPVSLFTGERERIRMARNQNAP